MKKELSALEIRQLVNEFQFLVDARIEKIYQVSKKEFIFKIHHTGGDIFLKIQGKFIYLSSEKGDTPETPSSLCTILRKNLENRKIRKIWQKGSERIVIFETESTILIAELFGQQNLILCDSDYKVIAASRVQKEGRIISRGEKYNFPEEKINAFKISENEFSAIISSGIELVKSVAGLIGGVYAEEVCLRAKIDKNSKKISRDESKKLYYAFVSLLKQEPSPMIVFEKEAPIDAVVFELEHYAGKSKVLFSNFYEAVESYLFQSLAKEKESEAEKKYNLQIEKINSIIKMQEKRISELREEAERNQRAGELIYEKYQEISDIMKELQEAKNKMSWEEMKSKIKNKKITFVDEKDALITVDL